MNDFTKEDLEQLKYHLFGNPKVHTKLCQKIQSMIDNYCEHPQSYRYRYDGWMNYCDKCKYMWKENDNQ